MSFPRRELLTGAALLGAAPAAAAGTQADGESETHRLLGGILDELRSLRSGCPVTCGEIEQIPRAQHEYLRATGRFPEFIEVGSRYWELVYDWLRARRPPDRQLADGRRALRAALRLHDADSAAGRLAGFPRPGQRWPLTRSKLKMENGKWKMEKAGAIRSAAP